MPFHAKQGAEIIPFIGWAAVIFGGAYVAAGLAFVAMGLHGGGLEVIPGMLVAAGCAAAAWMAFAVCMSPVMISF